MRKIEIMMEHHHRNGARYKVWARDKATKQEICTAFIVPEETSVPDLTLPSMVSFVDYENGYSKNVYANSNCDFTIIQKVEEGMSRYLGLVGESRGAPFIDKYGMVGYTSVSIEDGGFINICGQKEE